MIFVPHLWEDEMLSSWLTRAGKCYGRDVRHMSLFYFGITSICHPQYPKHVPLFSNLLKPVDTETLIAKHTFYPLVAPFAETPLRERLLDWLNGNPSGLRRVSARMLHGSHLETYRFCERCWQEQNEIQQGDMGWLRSWQIPQSRLCPRHKIPLMDTGESFRDRHGATRNIDWTDINLDQARPLEVRLPQDLLLTETAAALLERPLTRLPEKEHWDRFWERKLHGFEDDDLNAAAHHFWGQEILNRLEIERVGRDFLKGVGRRIWWKNLILLKAVDPTANLCDVIEQLCVGQN